MRGQDASAASYYEVGYVKEALPSLWKRIFNLPATAKSHIYIDINQTYQDATTPTRLSIEKQQRRLYTISLL
jgi:hypothetical protein